MKKLFFAYRTFTFLVPGSAGLGEDAWIAVIFLRGGSTEMLPEPENLPDAELTVFNSGWVPTNKKLALAFWEYLISKEVQEKLVAKMGWPSARTDAYATVEAWQAPYFEAVKEALKYTQPRPNLSYWATLDKSLNAAFREIVMEGRPAKEVLDKYHEVVAAAASKSK